MKISSSSNGCESRPVKAEPGRPEASLARCREIGSAMRRYASLQAVADGFVRYNIPVPREMGCPEGSSVGGRENGRERRCTGGVVSHGMRQEDGPVTWETLPPPRSGSDNAERSVLVLRRLYVREPCAVGEEKRSLRGKVVARGTGAAADGRRESEDRIGAMTSGNGVAPEADRAKAVRVIMNARRDPWSVHRDRAPCHRNCWR